MERYFCFLRRLRCMALEGASSVQQMMRTSMIPKKMPMLSMQTSRMDGPRPATKD